MSAPVHPLFAEILRVHFPALDAPRVQPCGIQCAECGRDEWLRCDDSFDHAFGTHVVPPYLECNVCGATAALPEIEP